MKHLAKYLCIGLLYSASIVPSYCGTTNSVAPAGACGVNVKTVFVPMTQGQNLYTQYHKPLFVEGDDCCCWAADLSATYRYQAARNTCGIAQSLFGSNTLAFQGADTKSSPNSLVAEYFGMAPDTDTALTLCPKVRNNILDLQLALSGEKFWFQINVPLVWANFQINKGCSPAGTVGTSALQGGGDVSLAAKGAQWTGTSATPTFSANDTTATNINGIVINDTANSTTTAGQPTFSALNDALPNGVSLGDPDGTTNISEAYFGIWNSPEVSSQLIPSEATTISTNPTNVGDAFTLAVSEVAPAQNLSQALGGYCPTGSDLKTRLYNKFNFNTCGTGKFGVADVPLLFGWDFCKNDSKHFGLYVKFVIPSGTQINQCFLQQSNFAPVIGNGRHFELGIGLTGHMNFCSCDESDFSANIDAYITHMFGTNSFRTWDATSQPMSRYALVRSFDSDGAYTGTLSALGDLNNQCASVSVGARGEAMIDFIYACRCWEMGIGYAFAGQSAETANCCGSSSSSTSGCCTTNPTNQVGPNYGYMGNGNATLASLTVGNVVSPAGGVLANAPIQAYAPASSAGACTGPASGAPTINLITKPTLVDYGTNKNTQGSNITGSQYSSFATSTNGAYDAGNEVETGNGAYLTLPDFGNCSGLMDRQILNRIFAHIDYIWRDCCWQPEFGILGSIGFGSANTPKYWDVGARFGVSF